MIYPKQFQHLNYHNHGTSPFFMGTLTISMAIFNSYLKLPEGRYHSVNIVTFFPLWSSQSHPSNQISMLSIPLGYIHVPYANHGAGRWIPTFAQHKSPSFVGLYIPAPWFAYGFGFDSKPTRKIHQIHRFSEWRAEKFRRWFGSRRYAAGWNDLYI